MIDPMLIWAAAIWILSGILHFATPFKQLTIALRESEKPDDLKWLFVLHGTAGALRPFTVLVCLFALLNDWDAWMIWLLCAGFCDFVQGGVSFFTYWIKKNL